MIPGSVEQAISELDLPAGEVRISAAHLVYELTSQATGETFSIAVRNEKAFLSGTTKFGALGGGINLTTAGSRYVQQEFQASQLEPDKKSGLHDARFIVPNADSARTALTWLADLTAARAANQFETDPLRELIGELSEFSTEFAAIVPDSEMPDWLAVEYLGIGVQPPAEQGEDTSGRATAIPSRRLFHLWRLLVSDTVFDRIVNAEQIACLRAEELETTCYGKTKGRRADGSALANNLGLITLT